MRADRQQYWHNYTMLGTKYLQRIFFVIIGCNWMFSNGLPHPASAASSNHRGGGKRTSDIKERALDAGGNPCSNPETLTSFTGVITLPGYPDSNYQPNWHCVWSIQVPAGNFLKFEFTDFNIEPHHSCTYDRLKIETTARSGSQKLCGEDLPDPVVVQSHIARVVFRSDDAVEEKGFRLTYSAIDPQDAPQNPCEGNTAVLTEPMGTIELTNSGNNYQGNMDCHWRIEVSPDQIVKLEYPQMDIEHDTHCAFDKLKVYDGQDAFGAHIATYCYDAPPGKTDFSTGNSLYLTFTSDASVSGRGFTVKYEAVDSSEGVYEREPSLDTSGGGEACGETRPEKFFQSSGEIQTTSYPNNANCQWLITVPDASKGVKIEVTDLDIEYDEFCMFDVLTIHDGSEPDDPVIDIFCGNTLVPGRAWLSTGNSVLLHLRSDESMTREGFSVKFTAVEPGIPACTLQHPLQEMAPGTLSVDLDLASYGLSGECKWQLFAPAGKVIHFHLNDMSISNSDCDDNKVVLFDGVDSRSAIIQAFCSGGQNHAKNFYSSTRVLLVYVSGLAAQSSLMPRIKFDATFTAVEPSEVSESDLVPSPVQSPAVNHGEEPCGIPRHQPKHGNARIVGGYPAAPNSWPWVVFLHLNHQYCGGSILNKRFILTAAHCTNGVPLSSITVNAGVHNRKDPTESTKQTRTVKRVYNHPNFRVRGPTQLNDISIIELNMDLRYNDEVLPACLARESALPGRSCAVTGWGNTFGTGDSTYLNQVYVPVISHQVCTRADYYGSDVEPESAMMCAGYEGGVKDSCSGDSGGPFFCPDTGTINDSLRRFLQYGIVSWGSSCAQRKKPGVYTRIATYIDWIKEVTGDNVQII